MLYARVCFKYQTEHPVFIKVRTLYCDCTVYKFYFFWDIDTFQQTSYAKQHKYYLRILYYEYFKIY